MKRWAIITACFLILSSGCAALQKDLGLKVSTEQQRAAASAASECMRPENYAVLKSKIVQEYAGKVPREWGEAVSGVKTRLATDQRVIALTFDVCGGVHGSGYDAVLIRFIERESIPATLFINSRWIDANPEIFLQLSRNPFFEIENHGLEHKPCSVTGKSVYGIQGTANVGEVVDEIELNGRKIKCLTGRKPQLFRPGTAYSDEVGVQVAHALGYEVVGFSVLGDAGATYTREQVQDALLAAPSGSIVILHMNHPEGETTAGVMDAVPKLKKKGFRFVMLSEFKLQ